MKVLFTLTLFIGLAPSLVWGADIHWVKLNSVFSYKDLSIVCSNTQSPVTLYFGAEVEGLEIKKAVFKTSPTASSALNISLSPEEIKGFTLVAQSQHLLLKTALMNSRLLNWMFSNAGNGLSSTCKPTQKVSSITPAYFAFNFDVESQVMDAGTTAESNLGMFRGKLKDGGSYQAELQFSEEPY